MSLPDLRTRLGEGRPVFGAMAFEFFTSGLPSVLAAAGAEFLIRDMEHSGASIETIKTQCTLSRRAGVVPIVRVPAVAYHLIAPVMDVGAVGIMAPMVDSVEQAELLAASARYRPQGRRGLGFRVGHDDYATTDIAATMAALNRRTIVIAMIETVRGLQNCGAIISVPGIDVGWIGHTDISDALGVPGQVKHPSVCEAVATVGEACARHGRQAGIVDADPEVTAHAMSCGYRMIGVGSDVALMQAGFEAGVMRLR